MARYRMKLDSVFESDLPIPETTFSGPGAVLEQVIKASGVPAVVDNATVKFSIERVDAGDEEEIETSPDYWNSSDQSC